MSSNRYILLCITSDTVIALGTGTFDEVTAKRKEYESVSNPIGSTLKIESIPETEKEQELLARASKLMEVYGHLI